MKQEGILGAAKRLAFSFAIQPSTSPLIRVFLQTRYLGDCPSMASCQRAGAESAGRIQRWLPAEHDR